MIEERWPLLRASCLTGGILLPVVIFLADFGSDAVSYERIAGSVLGGLLLCSIAAVVDNRRFVFDPAIKTLSWEQRNWFRVRGGRIPFSEIKDVAVTCSMQAVGDSPRRRNHYSAVLHTADRQIPLTATSGINRREYDELVEAILKLLGKGPRSAN